MTINNTILILVNHHPKIKPIMAFQYLSKQPGSTKKENNPVKIRSVNQIKLISIPPQNSLHND